MKRMGQKQTTYVSSSWQRGGTSRTSDNVVWSSSPGGGTEGEACRLRLHRLNTAVEYALRPHIPVKPKIPALLTKGQKLAQNSLIFRRVGI